MNKVSKFDTKRTVQLLFQNNGVKQKDMADDLQMTDGLLSGWLSPGNESDGFVYRYLRAMGWLSTNAPVVYNEIDILVQGYINHWRQPALKPDIRNPDLFVIDFNHLSSQAINAVLAKKPENEIKATLIAVETLSADFRRSLGVLVEATR